MISTTTANIFAVTCLRVYVAAAATTDVVNVRTTKDLRNAIYSPSIVRIRLSNSIRIDSSEWGWARPDIGREVVIEGESTFSGELVLHFNGLQGFVRVLPSGSVTISGVTIKGGLKSGDGSIASIVPFFSITKGGTLRLLTAAVDLGQYLCTVLPLDGENTMGEVLNAFLPEIQCEGMASTPELAIFPDCELPSTFFMDETENDGVGRVEMQETRLYCAGDDDTVSDRTTDIVLTTSDPAEILFAFARARDFANVCINITLNGVLELRANAWDDSIVFGEFQKYVVLLRGGSPGGEDRLVSYDNPNGYIMGANSAAHIMTENVILENPKLLPGLNAKLRNTPNVCDTDAYIMRWPVFLPTMFGGSGLDVTMLNTTVLYNHCPTNFSFTSFCRSLGTLAQQHNIFLGALDVECDASNPNRVKLNRVGITLPSVLRNGGLWLFHNFNLENVDVVCEAFDFHVDQIPMCSREVVGVASSSNGTRAVDDPSTPESSPSGACDTCENGAVQRARWVVWVVGFVVVGVLSG